MEELYLVALRDGLFDLNVATLLVSLALKRLRTGYLQVCNLQCQYRCDLGGIDVV